MVEAKAKEAAEKKEKKVTVIRLVEGAII
jgi:hypothetical protein